MGLTQEKTKYECPVCSSPLERDVFIRASESMRKRFHEELQRDEEEFERRLRRATEVYHKQVEELRVAHQHSQANLKKELVAAHQKEVVELTRYHDAIINDSHRQFHEAVRLNAMSEGPLTPPKDNSALSSLSGSITSAARSVKDKLSGGHDDSTPNHEV